jgi:hypothetical protein
MIMMNLGVLEEAGLTGREWRASMKAASNITDHLRADSDVNSRG